VVLIADRHEWSARSLASILTPHGYRILDVHIAAEVRPAAAARQPDAIVIHETLSAIDVLEPVRSLRADGGVPAETPVILAATGPASHQLRVAALRAGASDVWGLPMDADELVVRLEALLRARFAAARAREEGLVDWATGLYNSTGLAHRARDLASQATRRHAALACVVFAPDLEGAQPDEPTVVAAVEALAQALKQAGRASDAIGRLGLLEFAVLAPDTRAHGAVQLGTRLAATVRRLFTTPLRGRRMQLRAGYHAVDDFHAAGLEPLDLLAHASSALRAAPAGRGGGGDGDSWIRSFQSGLRGA